MDIQNPSIADGSKNINQPIKTPPSSESPSPTPHFESKHIISGLLIVLLFGALSFVLLKNIVLKQRTSAPVILPQPSLTPESTSLPGITGIPLSITQTAKVTPIKSASPTISPKPISSPTPIPTQQAANPTPNLDAYADKDGPVLTQMTGPENGTTIDVNNFCFPVHYSDNQSSVIYVRYQFDGSDWSPWGTDYAPCFYGVSNGGHIFSIYAKDESGNASLQTTTVKFTVQVP